MQDSEVSEVIAGTKRWNQTTPAAHVQLPPKWWLDEFIRDEVQMNIRGLIREGFSNEEVAMKIGCDGSTVQKQRVRMRTASGQRGRS